MSELDDIRSFVQIVQAGSISAAAAQAGLAKSVVSRRLRALESRLGVQLLRRTTRRLNLTPEGSEYFDSSLQILAALEDARDRISRAQTGLTGSLRIAAPRSFGTLHLTPALIEFTARYPGLELDLDFSDRRVDLVREGFDLAIRIGQLDDAELAGRRFVQIRHVLCASPAYLAQHGTPADPSALREHACLLYSGGPTLGWQYRDPHGRQGEMHVTARIRSNNGEHILATAVAGFGICLQPLFIACDAIEQGLLQPLLTQYDWTMMDGWLVYPRTRHLPRRVSVFMDFVAARFSGTPVWERCLESLP